LVLDENTLFSSRYIAYVLLTEWSSRSLDVNGGEASNACTLDHAFEIIAEGT
jgi:hypothetical protein